MKRRLLFDLFLLSLFVSALLTGAMLYSSMKDYALTTAHADAQRTTNLLAENISAGITEYQRAVQLLAGNEAVLKAIVTPTPQLVDQANRTLERLRKIFDAEACYLMNKEGITLASSNWDETNSFVGKNYGFRPYFKNAIQGRPFTYMAVGVTTHIPGIYYSCPVTGTQNRTPDGVVVIKASVNHLRQIISRCEKGYMMLTAPMGLFLFPTGKNGCFMYYGSSSPGRFPPSHKPDNSGKDPGTGRACATREKMKRLMNPASLTSSIVRPSPGCPTGGSIFSMTFRTF